MNSSSSTSLDSKARPAGPASEEQLAELMTDLTERLRRGEQPDIEAVVREHPDQAGELRELWAAAQIAHAMGHSSMAETAAWDSSPIPPNSTSAAAAVLGTTHRRIGDYELVEEIGRGGMGVVYRARQISLNRCQRALKTRQGAKLKCSHFEWREIRRGVASTTRLLTETSHGELAQDGDCRDDTTVTCVRLVAAAHCARAGD